MILAATGLDRGYKNKVLGFLALLHTLSAIVISFVDMGVLCFYGWLYRVTCIPLNTGTETRCIGVYLLVTHSDHYTCH